MAHHFVREVEPFERGKAPDKIILGLPGPRHLRLQLQRPDRDIVDMPLAVAPRGATARRSEGPTSELQSLMRISYAVFCLKKTTTTTTRNTNQKHKRHTISSKS